MDLGHFWSGSGFWAWIWAILDLFQRVWAYFEANLDQFRPFWTHFELFWEVWAWIWAIFSNFGVLGIDLGHSGPVSESLGLFRGQVGPIWAILGPFCTILGGLGMVLSHFWPIRVLGMDLGLFGPRPGHGFGPFLSHFGVLGMYSSHSGPILGGLGMDMGHFWSVLWFLVYLGLFRVF